MHALQHSEYGHQEGLSHEFNSTRFFTASHNAPTRTVWQNRDDKIASANASLQCSPFKAIFLLSLVLAKIVPVFKQKNINVKNDNKEKMIH